MVAYRVLQFLVRVALRAFFRRIEVVGLEHVPKDGAVIFCGNHPNSLLDPALITVTCGRVVHFAAKDVLFQSRLLRFFLTRFGAVPIRRRTDHGGGDVNNDDAFGALYDVLATGRTMGIFPEGLSHQDSQIKRLKTGAARIALGAARHANGPLSVVPCGLYYATRHRFRSSVLIQFGPPIVIDAARQAAHASDEREAVQRLTVEIDQGIRDLTVNADDWDTIRVLDGVRRLYQPGRISLRERVELARRFNVVYPTVKDHPQVVELYGSVQAYLDELDAVGLSDRDIVATVTPRAVLFRVLRHVVITLFWLPLAVVGAPIHLPVGILLYATADRFAPRKDVVATTKFLVGFLLLLLLYAVVGTVAAVAWGWAVGLCVWVGLPLSGYGTLLVIGHFGSVDRKLTRLLGRMLLGRKVRALKSHRSRLEGDIVALVNDLHPRDMKLMFPRG